MDVAEASLNMSMLEFIRYRLLEVEGDIDIWDMEDGGAVQYATLWHQRAA